MVGSYMYAAIGTRPDIAFSVMVLSRFGANPLKKHMNAAWMLLRYLKGTLTMKLRYKYGSETLPELPLVAHSDSDWGGNTATRKSVSGFCISYLHSSPMIWSSKSQTTLAMSTLEAEFIAASSATREIKWLRILINDVLPGPLSPTTLYCDNDGATTLIKTGIFKA